jgi:ketosteroid isomerase-like protein
LTGRHDIGALERPGAHNAEGQPIARFNSVWRQEAPGVWRIVFDKGSPLTPAERDETGTPKN